MKILHLVILFTIGGTEELFYNLIKHYPDPTTEHVIVNCAHLFYKKDCTDSHHARSLENLNNSNLRLIELNVDNLATIVAQEKPDLIHSINPELFPFAYSKFISNHIPFVPVWHNPPFLGLSFIPPRKTKTLLSLMKKKNIMQYSVSNYGINGFKKVFNYQNFETLQNGIDREKFIFSENARKDIRNHYGIPDNALVIGSVGRINLPWKRQDWLVDAIAYLQTKGHNNVYAMILGKGPGLKELITLTHKHHLESYIIFTGVQENSAPYYSVFDIFAHPSQEENCSLAIIEALSCGLPAVICYPFEPQENTIDNGYGIVQHRYNGIVVQSQNKQGFYQALEEVVAKQELREQYAGVARASTEKFDVKKMAERYHEVFKKTIAQHQKNREFN